ncbi:MAG: hypothetical protein ACP5G2_02045 [Candidatus Bipolaricaulaceae bacterium]
MKVGVPKRHGEVRWRWDSPGLVAAARRGWHQLAGAPWAGLRVRAREELGLPLDRPVVASGHQPVFLHPGILIRELLLAGLPAEVTPVWVSVDTDAPRAVGFPVPLRRRHYTHHFLSLVDNPQGMMLADIPAPSPDVLGRAAERMGRRLGTLRNVELSVLARRAWERLPPPGGKWAGWWERAEVQLGAPGGLRRLSARSLADTAAFAEFTAWLLAGETGFLDAYQQAARSVGVRPLRTGELPFWTLAGGQRRPARPGDAPLLPRALTLTLFVRALVCDFFLHGAGGASYEPGVDQLMLALGGQPPPWGWLTGTFLLPEPSAAQRLAGRIYPFFLYDLAEVGAGLAGPLAAL